MVLFLWLNFHIIIILLSWFQFNVLEEMGFHCVAFVFLEDHCEGVFTKQVEADKMVDYIRSKLVVAGI